MHPREDSEAKVSPVETAKLDSNFLRGSLAQELVEPQVAFSKPSTQLLKHHGVYQQDHRDTRAQMRSEGKSSGKAYIFMVRTRIPGGKLSSQQLLSELDLCDEIGNTTLRITTRQGLQLHGVLKDGLQPAIRRINQVQLTTLAACGDVERNVMCSPAPYRNDPVYTEMQATADALAAHLAPRTRAYYEVWLRDPESGERELVGGGNGQEDVEPIYGRTYLPRKFKTAIGLAGDNSVDLYAQDLGLMALCENGRIVGYNVLVGGGFGVTPSAEKTFPAVARPLAFIRPEQVVDVVTAVILVQRDYGNRQDRKIARLKYTLATLGLDKFKTLVEQYYGRPLEPARAVPVSGYDLCLEWHPQGDGRWFYGLNVENGRILDSPAMKLKTALRQVCTTLDPGIRLTPTQSILFTDIRSEDRERLETILVENGVKLSRQLSKVRCFSMACPALPTCGLAVTESERELPGMIDQLEGELRRLGLADEAFSIRMTGCPNGCARPYNSDVGLVGKTKGKYTVLLGGRILGDRLNFIYKDLVPADQVVQTLLPVLNYYQHQRQPGESFGDFCHRKGKDDLLAWSERFTITPGGEEESPA